MPAVFEDGQKGPDDWIGAGKQQVVGSEVGERREGQILEDLEGHCKHLWLLLAERLGIATKGFEQSSDNLL